MADGSIAVVGASEEQFVHIKQCLADWRCEEAVLKDEGNEISSIPVTALLVILFALKNKKDTMAICSQIRNHPQTAAIPILLAINQYDITQGSSVKRMGNATFIINPFKEEELREKIEQMKKESENHGPGRN